MTLGPGHSRPCHLDWLSGNAIYESRKRRKHRFGDRERHS